ncbi:Telomerase-binding protein EST1A [Caenorhabditis elegans]|uniref:Telomerase-binding protein EST1A n=1 Tax=Caenorhabditis elegans TaxID=6239 RepID=Q9TYV1_CAEEL|nr:Telomerase-binding protein EST1A [Caenorhabditis elegans]CCD61148.1 Telomerase-binding protein EST1A [Caenorhabditis elegans]|eukprot:NP_510861.1 Uncharacterized protein CELE_H11L12.1 [Caenorhabditis elegans]
MSSRPPSGNHKPSKPTGHPSSGASELDSTAEPSPHERRMDSQRASSGSDIHGHPSSGSQSRNLTSAQSGGRNAHKDLHERHVHPSQGYQRHGSKAPAHGHPSSQGARRSQHELSNFPILLANLMQDTKATASASCASNQDTLQPTASTMSDGEPEEDKVKLCGNRLEVGVTDNLAGTQRRKEQQQLQGAQAKKQQAPQRDVNRKANHQKLSRKRRYAPYKDDVTGAIICGDHLHPYLLLNCNHLLLLLFGHP